MYSLQEGVVFKKLKIFQRLQNGLSFHLVMEKILLSVQRFILLGAFFSNLKWGTSEPVLFRDSELKMIRIRSFGTYSIQINSLLFVNKIVGTRGVYSNNDITDYLREVLLSQN